MVVKLSKEREGGRVGALAEGDGFRCDLLVLLLVDNDPDVSAILQIRRTGRKYLGVKSSNGRRPEAVYQLDAIPVPEMRVYLHAVPDNSMIGVVAFLSTSSKGESSIAMKISFPVSNRASVSKYTPFLL